MGGFKTPKKKVDIFEEHMERFFEALKTFEINFNFSANQIYEELEKTRLSNNMNTDVVRFMVTRGKNQTISAP